MEENDDRRTQTIIGVEILAAFSLLVRPHLLKVPPQVPPTGHVDEYPESILNHLNNHTETPKFLQKQRPVFEKLHRTNGS